MHTKSATFYYWSRRWSIWSTFNQIWCMSYSWWKRFEFGGSIQWETWDSLWPSVQVTGEIGVLKHLAVDWVNIWQREVEISLRKVKISFGFWPNLPIGDALCRACWSSWIHGWHRGGPGFDHQDHVGQNPSRVRQRQVTRQVRRHHEENYKVHAKVLHWEGRCGDEHEKESTEFHGAGELPGVRGRVGGNGLRPLAAEDVWPGQGPLPGEPPGSHHQNEEPAHRNPGLQAKPFKRKNHSETYG